MEQSNQSKRVLLSVIGVAILVVAVVGVSFAFFNYTRAGADNSIGTGRIKFISTQDGTTAVSNFFPQIPGGASGPNSSVATVHITGGTTFDGGLQYRVRAVDVSYSGPVPVVVDVAHVTGLNTHGTFTPVTPTNGTQGVAIPLSEGVLLAEGTITVADTAANADTWINDGQFTVKAYIPDTVAITDTSVEADSDSGYRNGTTTEWAQGRTVITTAQWNALQANPVTFKIQVEAIEAGGAYTTANFPRTNP